MTRKSRRRQEERKDVIERKGERQGRRKLVNYERRKVMWAVYKSARETHFSRKTAIGDHRLRLSLQITEYTGLLPEFLCRRYEHSVAVLQTNCNGA
jgi:predicted nucleic acid-binding protein